MPSNQSLIICLDTKAEAEACVHYYTQVFDPPYVLVKVLVTRVALMASFMNAAFPPPAGTRPDWQRTEVGVNSPEQQVYVAVFDH